MTYKKGTKYKVMKPMKAKGENDMKSRNYDFNEIYEGNPNNAEYPAAMEEVKEDKKIEDKKIKKGKRGVK